MARANLPGSEAPRSAHGLAGLHLHPRGPELLVVPAEVGLSAHACDPAAIVTVPAEILRSRCRSSELHGGSRIDVAFQLTTDDDFPGAHAARHFRAGLDRHVPLHLNVALELPDQPDVPRPSILPSIVMSEAMTDSSG